MVHADFVAANDCASLLVSLDLVVPRVVADVLDSEALRRVRVQDETYQVLGLLREERGQFIVSTEDLLVEFLRVLVLEG